jgi:hypothetical protein
MRSNKAKIIVPHTRIWIGICALFVIKMATTALGQVNPYLTITQAAPNLNPNCSAQTLVGGLDVTPVSEQSQYVGVAVADNNGTTAYGPYGETDSSPAYIGGMHYGQWTSDYITLSQGLNTITAWDQDGNWLALKVVSNGGEDGIPAFAYHIGSKIPLTFPPLPADKCCGQNVPTFIGCLEPETRYHLWESPGVNYYTSGWPTMDSMGFTSDHYDADSSGQFTFLDRHTFPCPGADDWDTFPASGDGMWQIQVTCNISPWNGDYTVPDPNVLGSDTSMRTDQATMPQRWLASSTTATDMVTDTRVDTFQ